MAKIFYFADYQLKKYEELYKEYLTMYNSIIEKEMNEKRVREELKEELIKLSVIIQKLNRDTLGLGA